MTTIRKAFAAALFGATAVGAMAIGATTLGAAFAAPAAAQGADRPVKIGMMGDLASVYSDIGGKGGIEAIKMAIEDFGGEVLGKKIAFVAADSLNKPDQASAIARQWYDNDGVDVILDLPTSATALATMQIANDRKKIVMVTGAGSSDITGKHCSPYTAHWTWDTYANGKTVGQAIVKEGGDTWFFITADYVFGHSLERDTSEFVKAAGGKVLGSARHPLNNQDFSSFLLQAQSSKAKIVGLANGGGDTINSIKQAAEFGLGQSGQKLAGLVMFISDIHSLGLKTAQGLVITEAWYWDKDEKTREFANRFFKRTGRMPTMNQAANWSAVTHYLKAVKAVGSTDADKVMAKMRETPVKDMFTDNGVLRQDGRMVHSMLLLEVKKPEESKKPWDYYKIIAEVPGDQAFRPLKDGGCPLVK
ncbi:branched-chain amino acid transport system substrate-binding protein [Camelimonas lactis]|uniref:Branched-chain amino acid transport system substrate-binding protein n=2 Tax=Camelimonas lactis TaxID=659006 RepID=A0A4R2GQB1_9HYPH|nr:branched-chain amino acid transport system substrate-binding protein [Camelimonas lactis]